MIALTRRTLLTAAAAWPLAGLRVPSLQAAEPPRVLVLVELNGGNDGLDCIVPWADDVYHRSRTRTRIDPATVLKLDDYRGFHPRLQKLQRVFGDGRMAIVEGTGYPHPNHSHFTSQDIWHTARAEGRASGDGWVGRTMQALYPGDVQVPRAVHVGQSRPYALKSATHPVVCFDEPPAYRWAENGGAIAAAGARPRAGQPGTSVPSGMPRPDAESPRSRIDQIRSVLRNAKQSSEDVRRAAATYEPRVEYARDAFGQDLRTAAALLQSNIGCRVLSVTQQGYDTHEDQPRRHDILMAELDRGLSAFLEDVRGTPAGDNVVVLVFSEFGRRVEDNASMGTDHGTAGPMFLLGTPVKGGFYGKHPSLTELHDGDLVHTTDFRSVYASVLEKWLGLDSAPILGGKYAPIQGCLG